jgi:23S rRNA (pseudouridine1915-N3)-methyltransferase
VITKIIFIGKTTDSYLKEGLMKYEKRLTNYIPFEILVIGDQKSKNPSNINAVKQKEAGNVMKVIKPTDFVILLDEKGKEYSSKQFAVLIQKFMAELQFNLIFLIGGAYGFDAKIYDRANMQISMSNMTFSHQMIRLFFLEQLYRALTIIKNQPYHHD